MAINVMRAATDFVMLKFPPTSQAAYERLFTVIGTVWEWR